MSNSEKKMSDSRVTTMTYDLETLDDSNINQEVKDILAKNGWSFTISERTKIKYCFGCKLEKNVNTPNTTAWKEDISPSEACKEFWGAIQKYNTSHSQDIPVKRYGRGYAFAVRDNEYDAIKIC